MNKEAFKAGYLYKEAELPSSVLSKEVTPSIKASRLREFKQRTRAGEPTLYTTPTVTTPATKTLPTQATAPNTKLPTAPTMPPKTKPVSKPISKPKLLPGSLDTAQSPIHEIVFRNSALLRTPTYKGSGI